MERFSLNTARSLLGRNVNLHLTDGSVIINVRLSDIRKDELGKGRSINCTSHGNGSTFSIPLKQIAWAELLNLALILPSAEN
jgi:hypothetical protein